MTIATTRTGKMRIKPHSLPRRNQTMTENQPHPDDFADLRRRAEEKARADKAPTQESLSPKEAGRCSTSCKCIRSSWRCRTRNCDGRRVNSKPRARYFDLFDLAPVVYFTLGEQGLILEANITGAGLLGVERRDLIKQPFPHFILPENQDIYYPRANNSWERVRRRRASCECCERTLLHSARVGVDSGPGRRKWHARVPCRAQRHHETQAGGGGRSGERSTVGRDRGFGYGLHHFGRCRPPDHGIQHRCGEISGSGRSSGRAAADGLDPRTVSGCTPTTRPQLRRRRHYDAEDRQVGKARRRSAPGKSSR